MKRIAILGMLGCLVVLALAVNTGTTQATAPSGTTATFTYQATLSPYHFNSRNFKIDQKKTQDIVMRQITIAPGGATGWISHPGPTFVVVVTGTLSFYEAEDPTCTPTRYPAGQAFVQAPGDVHNARNEGTTMVTLEITFLDVPVGGAYRIDAPRPENCSF
jgi:quercetin dioxygenase-like cupin family protein